MTPTPTGPSRGSSSAPSLDGRYDVLRPIAEGGAAIVHEAVHLATGRRCAVKVLRRSLREQPALADRLHREARVLGRVRHPAVVDVLDAGVCVSWGPFVVMDLLEGRALDAILAARTRLSVAEALDVAAPVAEALASAHARGVVHCDVKPANVVVTIREDSVEAVKLIDWGLARFMRDTSDGATTGAEGERLGTAGYAAPEQWQGRPAGGPADVYALAVTIFECLAGALPHLRGQRPTPAASRGRSPLEIAAVSLPETVTPAVTDALLHGLAPDPAARPADPRALVAAIAQAAGHSPRPTALLGLASTASRTDVAHRRAYPRAPYRTPARVTFAAGALDGQIVDVSEGGVQLISPHACPVETLVQLRMALPMRGDVVTLDGKVRWARGNGGLHAIGVELAGAPPDVRTAIAKYVALMGQ